MTFWQHNRLGSLAGNVCCCALRAFFEFTGCDTVSYAENSRSTSSVMVLSARHPNILKLWNMQRSGSNTAVRRRIVSIQGFKLVLLRGSLVIKRLAPTVLWSLHACSGLCMALCIHWHFHHAIILKSRFWGWWRKTGCGAAIVHNVWLLKCLVVIRVVY